VTDQPEGPPLPPLESDDPAWVAARWREFAEGKGPRTARRTRWNATALKAWRADVALLDVLCKGRMIARVYDDGGLVVVVEAKTRIINGRQGGTTASPFALVHHPVVAVACRCGQEHRLRSAGLAEYARGRTPGKPHSVGVASVAEDYNA